MCSARTSTAAKAVGVVVVGLLAFRGIRLFFQNDVVISVSELVRLPPCGAGGGGGASAGAASSGPFPVQGKIEVETCVVRSYRFLLKLTAHVRDGAVAGGQVSDNSFSGKIGSKSGRHTARNRVQPTATGGTLSFVRSNSLTNSASASGAATTASSPSAFSRKNNPMLVLEEVHPMVDGYELDTTGQILFTPACISDEILLRYSTSVVPRARPASPVSSTASPTIKEDERVTQPCSISPATDFANNVSIRSCYLQADEMTSNGQRLSFTVDFREAVQGAKVVIRLPNRRCRLLRVHTGGLGRALQPVRAKPHHIVWDIGSVDANTYKHVEDAKTGRDSAAAAMEATREGKLVQQITASAGASAPFLLSSSFYLVFVQEAEDYDHTGESSSEDDDLNSEAAGDYDGGAGEDNSSFGVGGRRSTATSGKASRASDVASASVRSAGGKQSARAQRRAEERASKKRQKKGGKASGQLGSEASMMAARGVSTKGPSVELTYSMVGLVSGTAVRKLQVVRDAPNWVPRSPFDRYVLRLLLPGLASLKLNKFAHYTTWVVQPVVITQI